MKSFEAIDNAAAVAPPSFWKRYIAAIASRLERMPWLLPALSFGWGWLSFAMVRRGEEFARLMALLASRFEPCANAAWQWVAFVWD